jgi:hypothetical protein
MRKFQKHLSVAYLMSAAISQGCRGQAERPTQSAASTNAKVEPLFTGNGDGGTNPLLVQL